MSEQVKVEVIVTEKTTYRSVVTMSREMFEQWDKALSDDDWHSRRKSEERIASGYVNRLTDFYDADDAEVETFELLNEEAEA